jgi:hypothetical protein
VCFRAMAKDPNHRPPDAIALGRELQNSLTAGPARSRHAPLKWMALAAGLLVGLLFVVGVGIAIAIKFGRENNQTVNQNSTSTSTPVESPQVVSSSPVDLRGTWAGTYGPMGFATKLTIKNHDGNSLDGVLEQGTIRVAFKGTYDSGSRTLTMMQTEVLSGEGWSLGEDVGKLSADGKRISGTGKDAMGASLGMTYQWSFSRK